MPADAPAPPPEARAVHWARCTKSRRSGMQAIVEDLLILSTLESSPGSTRDGRAHVPADLDRPPADRGAFRRPPAPSRGTSDKTFADLLGSGSEIASAVSNLLTNAVRYTPDGGRHHRALGARRGRRRASLQRAGHRHRHPGAPHPAPDRAASYAGRPRRRSRAVACTGLLPGLSPSTSPCCATTPRSPSKAEPGKGSTFALRFPAERVMRADQPASSAS